MRDPIDALEIFEVGWSGLLSSHNVYLSFSVLLTNQLPLGYCFSAFTCQCSMYGTLLIQSIPILWSS